MRRLIYIVSLTIALSLMVGCKRIPSHVMDTDTMAAVMADLYVAEALVDQNPVDYPSDSSRLRLRQAIFQSHKVSQEKFDTSLVWYAHNIDDYIKVYEKGINLLQDRERKLGTAIVQANISASGDSVDVWPGSKYVRISDRYPSLLTFFDIKEDANWEPGDVYTWRVKVLDPEARSVRWSLYATYNDSTSEAVNYSSVQVGWNELIYPTDSTKTLTSLKGYFEVVPKTKGKQPETWVDSISLVRKRANAEYYKYRPRARQYPDLK